MNQTNQTSVGDSFEPVPPTVGGSHDHPVQVCETCGQAIPTGLPLPRMTLKPPKLYRKGHQTVLAFGRPVLQKAL